MPETPTSKPFDCDPAVVDRPETASPPTKKGGGRKGATPRPKKEKPLTKQKTRKSGKRTYETPDGEFPSVTTMIITPKEALIHWAANQEQMYCMQAATELYELLSQTEKFSSLVYEQVLRDRIGFVKKYQKELEAASHIGTQVHNRVEWDLRERFDRNVDPDTGEKLPPPPLDTVEARDSFLKFQEWEHTVAFKPVHLERVLWSKTHQYAGTTDWIGYVNGILTVGDWKTGKRIYHDSVMMQLSAYVMAAIEMELIEGPVQGCCVRLPKQKTDPIAEMKLYTWEDMQGAFEGFKHSIGLFHFLGGMGKGE